MSSKIKLNGFFLFMRDRRRQLETEGKTFPGGWKDVATCLNSDWKELTEDARECYRQRAKQLSGLEDQSRQSVEFSSHSGSDHGDLRRTSLTTTFQEMKDVQQERCDQKEQSHFELIRMLEHGDPKDVTFVIVNFSIYGQLVQKLYVPAEIGLTAFNVKQGVIDNFCTLIDPYEIPKGLGIEARRTAQILGVPYPPFDNRLQNYSEIVRVIEKFLDKHMHPKIRKWKLYCLNSEMQVNQGCLDWLYDQIPDKENEIELCSLGEAIQMLSSVGVANRADREKRLPVEVIETLMSERRQRDCETDARSNFSTGSYFMGSTTFDHTAVSSTSVSSGVGVMRKNSDDIIWKAGVFFLEKQVEDYLNTFNLAFDGEIGCLLHLNKEEGIRYCALNVTNRYAYNLLDAMVITYSVTPHLSYHQPDVRQHPENEKERRKAMLNIWGALILSEKEFNYDYKKKNPQSVTSYPEIGPNRPA